MRSAPTTDGAGGVPPGADLAQPVARRLRPPSWRDPRLVVGLLLVLASVVAGTLVVRSFDDTVAVWAARRSLLPGERLAAADLVVQRVRVGAGAGPYLSATRAPQGQVLLRFVGDGELLPAAALGDADQVELRPVAVPLAADAAEALQPGALVDVWVAARADEGADSFGRPRQVATGVQVAGLSASRGALGSTTTTAARLLLTPELVPEVIEAVDNQARVTLVPVPATLRRPGS